MPCVIKSETDSSECDSQFPWQAESNKEIFWCKGVLRLGVPLMHAPTHHTNHRVKAAMMHESSLGASVTFQPSSSVTKHSHLLETLRHITEPFDDVLEHPQRLGMLRDILAKLTE